jgi:putative holliday junction resolvase
MPKKEGNYLAFDFGMKRIGVAVGQTISATANPLVTLQAKEGVPNWAEVSMLINRWKPKGLIIGLPTMMDDSEQFITPLARDFAKKLGERFSLPTHLVDERLTSKEARSRLFDSGGYRALQEKGRVDQIAAVLILEDWLGNSDT